MRGSGAGSSWFSAATNSDQSEPAVRPSPKTPRYNPAAACRIPLRKRPLGKRADSDALGPLIASHQYRNRKNSHPRRPSQPFPKLFQEPDPSRPMSVTANEATTSQRPGNQRRGKIRAPAIRTRHVTSPRATPTRAASGVAGNVSSDALPATTNG